MVKQNGKWLSAAYFSRPIEPGGLLTWESRAKRKTKRRKPQRLRFLINSNRKRKGGTDWDPVRSKNQRKRSYSSEDPNFRKRLKE